MALELLNPIFETSSALPGTIVLGELMDAIANQSLTLHYQPKVSCRSGRIVGMEALLRWVHPVHGQIPPAQFVPLLESSGEIVQIGDWIIGTVCRQISAWKATGIPVVPVAVNLSATQLMQPTFYDMVCALIDKAGISPELLELELTESMLMVDVEKITSVMRQLNALGIMFSVDDFGTGYSSLAYLKRFPLTALKVDRSFVSDITADPNDVSITRAIITMAHALKLRVIAEGVETEGQLRMLIANHCDEIQGFLFSKALPADDMARLLKENHGLPQELLSEGKPERRLLLVDDEENILSALKRLFRGEGYEILTATGGEAGLELLAKQKVDVIVSDQRMPGMDGTEFLRRAKELHPETIRMVLSGYADLQTITNAINEGAIYKFLSKPWEAEGLCAQVAEAFVLKEMGDENRRLNEGISVANSELSKANARLEDMLEDKRRQIGLEEASLGTLQLIVETLPVALFGIDCNGMIAWKNATADLLFKDRGILLGLLAETVLPESLLNTLKVKQDGEQHVYIGERAYRAVYRPFGNAGSSANILLMLVPLEGDHA